MHIVTAIYSAQPAKDSSSFNKQLKHYKYLKHRQNSANLRSHVTQNDVIMIS